MLPTLKTPPLARENRLYQADWLLRYYNFKVKDILDNGIPVIDLDSNSAPGDSDIGDNNSCDCGCEDMYLPYDFPYWKAGAYTGSMPSD